MELFVIIKRKYNFVIIVAFNNKFHSSRHKLKRQKVSLLKGNDIISKIKYFRILNTGIWFRI